MTNSKISIERILFSALLGASSGVAILSFVVFYIVSKGPQIISIPFLWWSLNFSFPSWSGLLFTSIVGIILGFILVKATQLLFQGILVGFFLGLFMAILSLSWDLGVFLLVGINRFILENLQQIEGNVYISLLFFILLTTFSGLLGGILAKLYQKVLRK